MDTLLKLKNGGEVPQSVVVMTMMVLKDMWKEGLPSVLAIVELANCCRKGTEVSGRSRELLVRNGLMYPDGRVHDSIKDVVLSACEVEGLAFQLTSPVG